MALAAFREAEAIQKERQPQYPLLYSLRGYHYCDLLLDLSRPDQAQRRSGGMGEDDANVEEAGTAMRLVRPTMEPADESPEQAIAGIREARNRAETALNIAEQNNWPLDMGLAHLTLGRTYLLEGQVSRVESRES